MQRFRSIVVLAACLALPACERLSLVKRCRALAARANPAFDAIAEATDKGRDARAYARAAHEYQALAGELEGFDAGIGELDRSVEEYAGTLRSSARSAQALAEALDGGNSESATLAGRELERLARRHKSLSKRVDEACRPR